MKFEEYRKKIEDEVKDKIYSKSYNDALELFVESPDIFLMKLGKV
jgi:hypothetical protein